MPFPGLGPILPAQFPDRAFARSDLQPAGSEPLQPSLEPRLVIAGPLWLGVKIEADRGPSSSRVGIGTRGLAEKTGQQLTHRLLRLRRGGNRNLPQRANLSPCRVGFRTQHSTLCAGP